LITIAILRISKVKLPREQQIWSFLKCKMCISYAVLGLIIPTNPVCEGSNERIWWHASLPYLIHWSKQQYWRTVNAIQDLLIHVAAPIYAVVSERFGIFVWPLCSDDMVFQYCWSSYVERFTIPTVTGYQLPAWILSATTKTFYLRISYSQRIVTVCFIALQNFFTYLFACLLNYLRTYLTAGRMKYIDGGWQIRGGL